MNKTLKFTLILLFGFFTLGSFAQKNKTIDSLEIALLKEKKPQNKTDILIRLSEVQLSSDLDKALEYANQSLAIAEENDFLESKLLIWLQMGDIYFRNSNYKASLEIGYKARSLAENLDFEKEYAESLILISRSLSYLGDYEKSLELSFKALKIFENIDNKKGIGKALSQVGHDYFDLENYDKALEYDTLAIKIARQINDSVGISQGLNNIAGIYGNKGEDKNLKASILEALEINKKIGQRLWEGINYLNLGLIYKNEKNIDTSFYYYNKADKIFTELNNLSKLSAINNSWAIYYSDLNKNDKSLYYAKLAYNIGRESQQKKSIYNAAKLLHTIYFEQNDFVNAYKYSIIENNMKDSLGIENRITQLNKAELLYNFEKIEQENKLKQQQKESVYILAGTGFLFVFVLLGIIIIFRNSLKRKNEEIEKQKLKSQIDIRDKELTSNAMSLMMRNEVISDIAGKLMDIRITAVKDETKIAIKKIVKELQSSKDKGVWKEFDIRFKQVHTEFYDKLIEKFPGLTPTEQRLCAFLRLNMTTKEISELTGQRIGTIEMARSRVRKKLGIAHNQTNLITFLTQI